jgi:hypothetical protein
MLVSIHYPHAAGLVHRHLLHRNSGISLISLMEGKHLGIIHFVNMIATQNQNIIRVIFIYKANVLINGICRTGVPLTMFTF